MQVRDERFARLHTDPRFQRLPQKERKVQVDNRFASMFSDQRFNSSAPVDKYGRPDRGNKQDGELRRLYELETDNVDGAPTFHPTAARNTARERVSGKKVRKDRESNGESDQGIKIETQKRKKKLAAGRIADAGHTPRLQKMQTQGKGAEALPVKKKKSLESRRAMKNEDDDDEGGMEDWMARIAASGAKEGEDTESESDESESEDGQEHSALVAWIEER